MNHNKGNCDPTQISRFVDHELNQEEYDRVTGHIEQCPWCRKTLEEMKSLSATVNDQLPVLQPERTEGSLEEKVLTTIQKRKVSWWSRTGEMLLSKKVLIPLTTTAALVLFFSFLFYPPAPAGPSAIVTSLSGNMTSVIIMETPETRQTILWFNENLVSERQEL